MAEQVSQQVAVDPVPEEQIMKVPEQQQKIYSHSEPKAIDPSAYRYSQPPQKRAAGPQIWAVVLTLGGLYYIWTRVLGKPLPSRAGLRGGNSMAKRSVIGGNSSSSNRQAEIAAARERQQQKLELMSKAKGDKNSNIRERTNATTTSGNSSSSNISILQQQQLLKQQKADREKQQELDNKKKKQRQLYLKQKAEREKEEEKRRKDAELGPGWEYRQDPSAAGNSHNSMDPQAGSNGGGYKPQTCTKRGG